MTCSPGETLPNRKSPENGKNDPLKKTEFRWGVLIMLLLMGFVLLEAGFGLMGAEIPKALNDLIFLITGSFLVLLNKMLEN